MKDHIYEYVKKFMIDNVSCEEAIYQCDWISLNALDFIADLYDLIKEDLPQEEE